MPKIFALRHQLAEQQARLKQFAKGGDLNVTNISSSDEERFDDHTLPHNVSSSSRTYTEPIPVIQTGKINLLFVFELQFA